MATSRFPEGPVPQDRTQLEAVALDAWTCAFTARRDGNWGRAVRAQNSAARLKRAAHPRIRRLAYDLDVRRPEDLCA